MTPETLLAEAAQADREADAIFAAMNRASEAAASNGSRPLVPAGWHDRAEKASDLRRRAKWLRAEAAPPAVPLSAVAALASPSPELTPPAAASTPPEPEIDPVEALVARIMGA